MSTSFATMLTNVYALTNRPDLVNESTLALQNATLKAHRSDYYPKDLFETGISFDSLQNLQTTEYKTLVPQWRSISYLRVYDVSTDQATQMPGRLLKLVAPESVLDEYYKDKVDVYYLAGINLNIVTRCPSQYFLLGCYIYPLVDTVNYKSWIADEHPAVILYEAAATVFKTIGYDEQAANYRAMISDEMIQLTQQVVANGY